MGTELLELRAQLVQRLLRKRCQQLVPDNQFGAPSDVRPVRRHDDPQRPGRERPEHVRAPVVRRHDLDIEHVILSVYVVLDAQVGKLHVALVVARQVVLPCPVLNLQRVPVRPAIAVVAVAIALLQELLVLRFQLVLEDDAMDVRVDVVEALGFSEVGR